MFFGLSVGRLDGCYSRRLWRGPTNSHPWLNLESDLLAQSLTGQVCWTATASPSAGPMTR
jgi:hypothetical protein